MTNTVTADSRHFTASAVVFDPQQRTVLLVAHKATGRWQFPGGHVDPNEAAHETVLREIAEETGVTIQFWIEERLAIPVGRWMPSPFMTCEFPAPPKPHLGEPAHHHIDLLYLATADSTAPLVHQPEEVDAAVWRPIDALGDVREDVPVVVARAWPLLAGGAR